MRIVLRYRLLGRRIDLLELEPGRCFVSPPSNRNIDEASPPALTAEVTIRANAHTIEAMVTQTLNCQKNMHKMTRIGQTEQAYGVVLFSFSNRRFIRKRTNHQSGTTQDRTKGRKVNDSPLFTYFLHLALSPAGRPSFLSFPRLPSSFRDRDLRRRGSSDRFHF